MHIAKHLHLSHLLPHVLINFQWCTESFCKFSVKAQPIAYFAVLYFLQTSEQKFKPSKVKLNDV